jgi:multidrug resistance efflux pump
VRIDFHKDGELQVPVSPIQEETRKSKSRKIPVLRILVVIAVLSAIGYAAYKFQIRQTIYAYGIATGETAEFTVPYRGTISDLNVGRGSRVQKGDLLFRITPDISPAHRKAQEESQSQLDSIARQEQSRLDAAVETARQEVKKQEALMAAETAKNEHDVELARIEVRKFEQFHSGKKDRYSRMVALNNMDAAVLADVKTAEGEMKLAEHNLEQARADLDYALKRSDDPGAASLEQAKQAFALAELKQQPPALLMEQSRLQMADAAARQDPMEFRALFDGVVMETSANNGNSVEAGRSVVGMVSADNVWIEAYIPSDQASANFKETGADVYIGGAHIPVHGKVQDNAGGVSKVPGILKSRMPGYDTVGYLRVALKKEDMPITGTIVRVVIQQPDLR